MSTTYKWLDNLLSTWGSEMLGGGSKQEIGILGKIQDLGLVGAAIRSTGNYSVTPPLSDYTEKVNEALTKLPQRELEIIQTKYIFRRSWSNEKIGQKFNIDESSVRYSLEKSYSIIWDDLADFRRQFE